MINILQLFGFKPKLVRLVEKAYLDPELGSPGACRYVDGYGKRCILGTILHQAGVPDDVLRLNNAAGIGARGDLHADVERLGIDIKQANAIQRRFDGWVAGSAFALPATKDDILKIAYQVSKKAA